MSENYAEVPEDIWQEAHRLFEQRKGLTFKQALAAARAKASVFEHDGNGYQVRKVGEA